MVANSEKPDPPLFFVLKLRLKSSLLKASFKD